MIYNPEMRNVPNDPFGLRIKACLAFAIVRILDEVLSVPDQASNVEFVIKDTRTAAPVAMDGRGAPGFAVRTVDTIMVEGMGN
jgi:hypothetical protein